MNATDTRTFDGRLERIRIYADNRGFTLRKVELREGLEFDEYSEKKPFDFERISLGSGDRVIRFGRILDETGFKIVLEKRKAAYSF